MTDQRLRDTIVLGICEMIIGAQDYGIPLVGTHTVDYPSDYGLAGFSNVDFRTGRITVLNIITTGQMHYIGAVA